MCLMRSQLQMAFLYVGVCVTAESHNSCTSGEHIFCFWNWVAASFGLNAPPTEIFCRSLSQRNGTGGAFFIPRCLATMHVVDVFFFADLPPSPSLAHHLPCTYVVPYIPQQTNTVRAQQTALQEDHGDSEAPLDQAPGCGRREKGSPGGDARGAGTEAGYPGHPEQGCRPQLQQGRHRHLQRQQGHRHFQRHGPPHALVGLLFLETVCYRRRWVGRRSGERRGEHGEGGEVRAAFTFFCLRPRILLGIIYSTSCRQNTTAQATCTGKAGEEIKNPGPKESIGREKSEQSSFCTLFSCFLL